MVMKIRQQNKGFMAIPKPPHQWVLWGEGLSSLRSPGLGRQLLFALFAPCQFAGRFLVPAPSGPARRSGTSLGRSCG
jgi:hypothetical protein